MDTIAVADTHDVRTEQNVPIRMKATVHCYAQTSTDLARAAHFLFWSSGRRTIWSPEPAARGRGWPRATNLGLVPRVAAMAERMHKRILQAGFARSSATFGALRAARSRGLVCKEPVLDNTYSHLARGISGRAIPLEQSAMAIPLGNGVKWAVVEAQVGPARTLAQIRRTSQEVLRRQAAKAARGRPSPSCSAIIVDGPGTDLGQIVSPSLPQDLGRFRQCSELLQQAQAVDENRLLDDPLSTTREMRISV